MRALSMVFWLSIHLMLGVALLLPLVGNKDVTKGIAESLKIGITRQVIMDYSNYNSSWTNSYKSGYIFWTSFGSYEVVRVMVDKYAYPIEVKSIHAAKIMITKHSKKYGG